MGRYKGFRPDWESEAPVPGSWRSLFKWGDPESFKEPNERLYRLCKETFALTDEDFREKENEGNEPAAPEVPSGLNDEQLAGLREIVGEAGVSTRSHDRLGVAYGNTMWDLYRLREKIAEYLPDAVVYPGSREDVEALVAWSVFHGVPLQVYGGGSSVTRGLEARRGGITLDMRRRFNKVVSFDEANQTITVEAGLSGPDLEAALNEAPRRFGARRRYTCGHFPQSFEYSSVGGWVVTRGAGSAATTSRLMRSVRMWTR